MARAFRHRQREHGQGSGQPGKQTEAGSDLGSKTEPTTSSRGPGSRLDRASAISEQIDENLRLIYRQCLEEEVPLSLKILVDRLCSEMARADERALKPDPRDRPGPRPN